MYVRSNADRWETGETGPPIDECIVKSVCEGERERSRRERWALLRAKGGGRANSEFCARKYITKESRERKVELGVRGIKLLI